jgi:hypothetical protein
MQLSPTDMMNGQKRFLNVATIVTAPSPVVR